MGLRPTGDYATPGLLGLSCRKKQAEQSVGRKPVSSTPLRCAPDPPSKFLPRLPHRDGLLDIGKWEERNPFLSQDALVIAFITIEETQDNQFQPEYSCSISPNKSPLVLLVNVTSLFKHKVQELSMLTVLVQSYSEWVFYVLSCVDVPCSQENSDQGIAGSCHSPL